MRKSLLSILAALAFVGACSKSPEAAALGLLKGGDRAGALASLQAAAVKHAESVPTHLLLFTLYQYQASQGEPAKHDVFLQSAITEYSWIARNYGISADYKDMEGSLKSNDKAHAPYEAAYAAVYAR